MVDVTIDQSVVSRCHDSNDRRPGQLDSNEHLVLDHIVKFKVIDTHIYVLVVVRLLSCAHQ